MIQKDESKGDFESQSLFIFIVTSTIDLIMGDPARSLFWDLLE